MSVAYLAAECKTNLDKTMFNEGLETLVGKVRVFDGFSDVR